MNIVLNGFFECFHILSCQQQVLDVRVIGVHLKADNLIFLPCVDVIEIFTITDELSQYALAEWQGGNNDQVRLLCLLGLLFGIDFTINDATFCPAVLVGLDTVLNSEILTRCNVSSVAGFSFEQLQLTTAPVFYQLIAVSAIRKIGGEAMTRMSTIYSRLSYGTGTTLTGCGVSAKAYAETAKTAKEVSWTLAEA